MDLQIHIESRQKIWYMPGEAINGWVRCRSNCIRERVFRQVHVNLGGECCTTRGKQNGARTDGDLLVNESIIVYDASDVNHRDLAESTITAEFIKIPFTINIPKYTSHENGNPASALDRVRLPPSFSKRNLKKDQYINYWVAAWGSGSGYVQAHIDKHYITVMSWDPEEAKKPMRWPRLDSCDPYLLQTPTDEWRVISEYVPVSTIVRKRSDYLGQSKPEKLSPAYTGVTCDQCHNGIHGPRFCCSHSTCKFTWCWQCMADLDNQHHSAHALYRIDDENAASSQALRTSASRIKTEVVSISPTDSGPSTSARTPSPRRLRDDLKHLASSYFTHTRSSSSTTTQETSIVAPQGLQPRGNDQSILEIVSDAVYQVWVPNRETFPHDTNIPLLTKITVRSDTEAALPGLLPTLPWNAPLEDGDSEPTSHNGPLLTLRVSLASIVDNRKEVHEWWRTFWPNMGEWYKPGFPVASDISPPLAFSHGWSTPTRSDTTGKYEQSAVICSWIHRALFSGNDGIFHEPHFDMRVLRNDFQLEFKHRVGGKSVQILLSQAPWTSGIYHHDSSGGQVRTRTISNSPPSQSGSSHERLTTGGGSLSMLDPPPPYLPN